MNVAQLAFAIGMIASGVLNIVNRDFYSPWDPVSSWLPAPAHVWLASASGVLMILGGIGLAFPQVATRSARLLFVYILLFLVLLKAPVLFTEPQNEVHWLAAGEIAVLAAGALALSTTNETTLRTARYLLGAALIPIGLSHFVFLTVALPMVPSVLPFHSAWVIFTGIAHIAAGVAILVGFRVWLATVLEAGMITAFAFLVWALPIFAAPRDVSRWTPFVVTLAVAGGAWAVASTMRAPTPAIAQP